MAIIHRICRRYFSILVCKQGLEEAEVVLDEKAAAFHHMKQSSHLGFSSKGDKPADCGVYIDARPGNSVTQGGAVVL
jgi:hypothetical protein